MRVSGLLDDVVIEVDGRLICVSDAEARSLSAELNRFFAVRDRKSRLVCADTSQVEGYPRDDGTPKAEYPCDVGFDGSE